MDRSYRYVGRAALRDRALAEPRGTPIASRDALRAWLDAHPDALTEGATFVVTPDALLRLAPRRSEHVACAAGAEVLAAGELVFARHADALRVSYASNQSTGYCPEPDCFVALARALDALAVARPPRFTVACTFRRCPACRELNLVKDDDWSCACCGADLPRAWNLAP